jgi:hypothetical protein
MPFGSRGWALPEAATDFCGWAGLAISGKETAAAEAGIDANGERAKAGTTIMANTTITPKMINVLAFMFRLSSKY